jgi:hypothetical protein
MNKKSQDAQQISLFDYQRKLSNQPKTSDKTIDKRNRNYELTPSQTNSYLQGMVSHHHGQSLPGPKPMPHIYRVPDISLSPPPSNLDKPTPEFTNSFNNALSNEYHLKHLQSSIV